MSQPPPENPHPGDRPPPGDQPPPYQSPPHRPAPDQPPGNQYGGGYGAPPRKPGKGMAVVALVFGILALLFFWTLIGGLLFGLIALIVGLVASGKAKRGTAGGRGMAIVGIVLGLLGALLSAAIIALGLWISADIENLRDCLDQAGSDQSALDQCGRDFQDDIENRFGG